MSLIVSISAWAALSILALFLAMALGKASKRGDDLMWRSRLTRLLADRGRRAQERRGGDRRRRDVTVDAAWDGEQDRRRGERRGLDRRIEPAWRDVPSASRL